MPNVSVIIPAFNSARYIGEAVDSVLRQTRPAEEIIIVDDGSTDDTRVIAAALPVKYIYQKNAGPSAARNTGLRHATGELLAFLDADDLWLPHKLAAQLTAFENFPDAGFSFSTVWHLYAGTNPKISHDPYYPPQLAGWLRRKPIKDGGVYGSVYDLLLRKNCVATSSMVVRREIVERAGEFDTALWGCEDYDYWIRLARLAPAVFIEQPVSRYRIVDEGLSGAWNARYERFFQTAVQVVGAHMREHPSLTVRRAMGASLADYAFYCLVEGRISQARQLSGRSLKTYPTRKGLKTFCEALLPRAFSALSQIAHLGRYYSR
jgi:glycosyltransferase involved in cell wall biosynthesis